nr:cell division topological specificity factor MinE [Gammaproteobacteria bacterium]
MGLFDYFKPSEKKSASVARERLQIILAHERAERNRPSYLPKLQKEILAVVRKYVEVDQEDVEINLDRRDDCEILALSVTL